jgi:galactarate dehydratase
VRTIPSSIIRLHQADNVGVTRFSLATIDVQAGNMPRSAAPEGHKVAVQPIRRGDTVVKYGQVIGFATCDIAVGEHVHTHNLASHDTHLDHHLCVDAKETIMLPAGSRARFKGYRRTTGSVGTRNYIAIIASVNCSATVSHAVARHFAGDGRLDAFPNVDGVVALTHGGGCAIGNQSEGYRYLTRTLAGYALNPNVGGVLMIGLGCETNQIAAILRDHGLTEGATLQTMTIQNLGGTRKTIAAGIDAVNSMLPAVNDWERTIESASSLIIGLQCGGSDGYSGISANPALGFASDLLVRHGGTAVLAETPEIYGAEHLLARRAASPEVAQKLLERIEWWKKYAARNKAELNDNPSHGNKTGGLTTILEKSLGAVAKGGTSRLEAVYEYAEFVTARGLIFMDTPGYDPISVTGQIAGGCNLIVFTTGRGSTSGYKPVPCIKLATNTPMFEHMSEDMDLDCGGIITGDSSVEQVGGQIFQKILEVASGAPSRSEGLDYGDNEFVPWQVGAIM